MIISVNSISIKIIGVISISISNITPLLYRTWYLIYVHEGWKWNNDGIVKVSDILILLESMLMYTHI